MPTLREYPYQLIAYLEDVDLRQISLEDGVLHCTLLRRFRLKPGVTREQILQKLNSLAPTDEIIFKLAEPAKWSSNGEQILLEYSDKVEKLKKDIDLSLKELVELRDPEWDSYQNLHVSIDTRHKADILSKKSECRVERLGLQIDYEDVRSDVIYLGIQPTS
jgi:hypothetical protein